MIESRANEPKYNKTKNIISKQDHRITFNIKLF